jgi:hypothetical protein
MHGGRKAKIMAFDTPFIADNQPEGLVDFGFYKVQRHTKSAIIGMLKNFFDSVNSTYKLQVPEIVEVQNTSSGLTKIFIERDFLARERRIPMILVAMKGSTEKKMYLGADDLACWDIVETSSGRKFANRIYHGASEISLVLIVIAQSSEERMRFAELISLCFTHYYRWQYFYTYGDGNTLSITPNTKQLDFGAETEVNDISATSLLYLVDISMDVFVEYSFRDVLTKGVVETVEIDESSGPLDGTDLLEDDLSV